MLLSFVITKLPQKHKDSRFEAGKIKHHPNFFKQKVERIKSFCLCALRTINKECVQDTDWCHEIF